MIHYQRVTEQTPEQLDETIRSIARVRRAELESRIERLQKRSGSIRMSRDDYDSFKK